MHCKGTADNRMPWSVTDTTSLAAEGARVERRNRWANNHLQPHPQPPSIRIPAAHARPHPHTHKQLHE